MRRPALLIALAAAKADGYQLITPMTPDMGWHYRNPTIEGFDATTPAILVYERHRHSWQLAALEPAPGSPSGTPTWSPSTSGSGTPTPTASTTAPTPSSTPSTTASYRGPLPSLPEGPG